MKFERKNLVFFSFGIIFGFTSTLVWRKYYNKPKENLNIFEQIKGDVILERRNQSLAENLKNEVRVLCWVMTNPRFHKTRAIYIKRTWGARCNKLLFMSSVRDSELDSIALPVQEGHNHLWEKTRNAFEYIYKHHLTDADWFLKVEDDTYVVVENLRQMLYPHKPETPIYFGCRYKPFTKQGFMAGGSGYVLSREALKRFAEQALPNRTLCYQNPGLAEDGALGVCLYRVGVVAGDSRDMDQRERFFPLSVDAYFMKQLRNRKFLYWKYLFYPPKQGFECCSDYPVSFHHIKGPEMYSYDYLIYRLHPYGIVRSMLPLPHEKISTEVDIAFSKIERNNNIPKIMNLNKII